MTFTSSNENLAKLGGGSNACPRCSKTVYAVEQVAALGAVYHKACLTCKTCNTKLDSTNLNDNNKEIYCKSCHTKQFGPKGTRAGATLGDGGSTSSLNRGTGGSVGNLASAPTSGGSVSNLASGGAGSTSNLAGKTSGSTSSLSAGPGDTCPVCQKKVYFAEQALGPGGIKYHKLCFKCSVCRKILDSSTLNEKDNVLFCNADYQKLHGPKGTRSGHIN